MLGAVKDEGITRLKKARKKKRKEERRVKKEGVEGTERRSIVLELFRSAAHLGREKG